jgi:lipopolysaccharide export system protein LptA
MQKITLLLLVLLLPAINLLAASEQLPQPSSLPIEVTAEQLEADQNQRQATFIGGVVAKQGDITLYCEKLVVYSLPDQDQVDRLEAFDNVRVVQLDRTATADRAVYRQLQGTLVLYGNAKVHQGQNQVIGDEITVYLNENRSVVKSDGSGRVRAVLFPEQKQGQE